MLVVMVWQSSGMTSDMWSGKDFRSLQRRSSRVFYRNYWLTIDGPHDPQSRVVPDKAAFVFWRPVVRGLIEDFGVVRHYGKSVSKALGNPDLLFVFCTQNIPDPASKRWRRFSKVHSHVEDDPGYDANQLSLWLSDLIMQPAHHILRGPGVVILNEGDVLTNGRIKCPAIKALEEEPPVVPVHTGLDYERTGYRKRGDFHV